MTERVMVDIETMGTEPGSVILSIGACRFLPELGVVGEGLYVEIDTESSREHGLVVDEDTRNWWANQGEDAPTNGVVSLPDALHRLERYLTSADEVWANSPKFDAALLENAYQAVGRSAPWAYYELRDVRTVRDLPCAVEIKMDGREHHALDDARHQAQEVAATLTEAEVASNG